MCSDEDDINFFQLELAKTATDRAGVTNAWVPTMAAVILVTRNSAFGRIAMMRLNSEGTRVDQKRNLLNALGSTLHSMEDQKDGYVDVYFSGKRKPF